MSPWDRVMTTPVPDGHILCWWSNDRVEVLTDKQFSNMEVGYGSRISRQKRVRSRVR